MLKNAVNAGIKQLRAYSQTASELKLTAKKLYEIADCALRLSMEETLTQNLRKKEALDEIISNEPLQMSVNV